MRLIIRDDAATASDYVSNYIIERIKAFNPSPSKPFVLGLPTGSSPIPVYQKLVQKYKNGEISFKNVITFNMDEYVGLPQSHPESYHSFMYTHFFSHIDIDPTNVNILNGNAPDLEAECLLYEEKIQRAGGIELFLGGIGADGHIAFNEPGSSLKSRTRVKTLAYETIIDNSRFFGHDVSKVPKMALTVGIQTILDAREVIIIITGARKALALQQSIECAVNHMCTLSSLQLHEHALLVCDNPATLELKVRTVKYFKDIEPIASSGGFTQNLSTSATIQEKRRSAGEELDEPTTNEFKAVLNDGDSLADPMLLGVGVQTMRSPTPELWPDRMSSRIGTAVGNGFGASNGAAVTLENRGTGIAVN